MYRARVRMTLLQLIKVLTVYYTVIDRIQNIAYLVIYARIRRTIVNWFAYVGEFFYLQPKQTHPRYGKRSSHLTTPGLDLHTISLLQNAYKGKKRSLPL